MEFDKLFKLVVNSKIVTEAEAAEDAEELADDSILSDDDLGTAEDSALDTVDTVDFSDWSPEQQIEYLIQHSTLLNNPNWTENEKRAKAEWVVKNELFDAFVEPIETRRQAQRDSEENIITTGVIEELTPELEDDAPGEDIEDISTSLDADRTLRRREGEGQYEDGLPS